MAFLGNTDGIITIESAGEEKSSHDASQRPKMDATSTVQRAVMKQPRQQIDKDRWTNGTPADVVDFDFEFSVSLDTKQVIHFGDVLPSQSFGAVLKKLNLPQ